MLPSLLPPARALLLALCAFGLRAQEVPQVAASSDLREALTLIADHFQDRTGHGVILHFAASGVLATRIQQGAGYQLFLSADEAYVVRLAEKGLTLDPGKLYGRGRLALFVPYGAPMEAAQGLEGLRKALAEGRITRFAIADPTHAPYGRAAKAALKKAGLWKELEPKLALAENAAKSAQVACEEGCQGGLIPLALAKSPAMEKRGAYLALPADLHSSEPLRQRMVLLKKAGATARAFYRYLQTPEALEVFQHFGFEPVEER